LIWKFLIRGWAAHLRRQVCFHGRGWEGAPTNSADGPGPPVPRGPLPGSRFEKKKSGELGFINPFGPLITGGDST